MSVLPIDLKRAIGHLEAAMNLPSQTGTVVVEQLAIHYALKELNLRAVRAADLEAKLKMALQTIQEQGDVVNDLTQALDDSTVNLGVLQFPDEFAEVWRAQAAADGVSLAEFLADMAARVNVEHVECIDSAGRVTASSRRLAVVPGDEIIGVPPTPPAKLEIVPDIAGHDIGGAFSRHTNQGE